MLAELRELLPPFREWERLTRDLDARVPRALRVATTLHHPKAPWLDVTPDEFVERRLAMCGSRYRSSG